MKILALADQPSDYLWGSGVRAGVKGVDMILSCGDLDARYLEFLVTMSGVPLLYVPGNHDRRYETNPPEGCENADGRIVVCKGLRVLGLGGSIRYNGNSPYQYTQREMERRVRRLRYQLWKHKGFDILLTHSAALGLGDGEDFAHRGFEAFLELLDRWSPPVFVHGHSHLNYGARLKRLSHHGATQVINAFERYIFEIDPPER